MAITKIDKCFSCTKGKIAKYSPYGTPDFYKIDAWGERDPMKWVPCERCEGTGKITYVKKTKTVWEPI